LEDIQKKLGKWQFSGKNKLLGTFYIKSAVWLGYGNGILPENIHPCGVKIDHSQVQVTTKGEQLNYIQQFVQSLHSDVYTLHLHSQSLK